MTSKKTSAEQRRERLAAALKRNIARRKGQKKADKTATPAPKTPPDDNGCPN
jgi:hypothetical protein